VSRRIDSFLSYYNRIAVKGDYLIKLQEQLHLHTASEEQLNRIFAAIESVSSRQGAERPTSARGESFTHPPPRSRIGPVRGTNP
jgi:hypothetical protein